MRFQRRTGQCGLPELLLSHSGAHSRSRGQHTVHIRCRCPVGTHSPTAIIRVQQFFPDQLHLCALLPIKLFHPSILSTRRGTSVSFPYKTDGLDVCIISRSTQFVNRLILLFSGMYFLHDNFALTGGILYSGSLAGKAGVCTLIRRCAPPFPGWGKAFAPAGFQETGNAPAAKKDCYTNYCATVLCIVIKSGSPQDALN